MTTPPPQTDELAQLAELAELTELTELTKQLLTLLDTNADLSASAVTDGEELARSWKAALRSEASGKWSRPVSRITGKPTTAYHAIFYTDMTALFPALAAHPAFQRFDKDVFFESRIAKNPLWWKILKELAASAELGLGAGGDEFVVPTTEEIRQSIEAKKKADADAKAAAAKAAAAKAAEAAAAKAAEAAAAKAAEAAAPPPPPPTPPTPFSKEAGEALVAGINSSAEPQSKASVEKAVAQTFAKLCAILAGKGETSGAKKFLAYTKSFSGAFVLEAFKKIHEANAEFEDACDAGDIEIIIDKTDWSPLIEHESRRNYFIAKIEAAENEILESVKQAFNQINSFVRVRANIPSAMMDEIETYTTGLMRDLRSKKKRLEDLDLEKIGAEVLKNCNETDIDKMGNNLNELLPVLQRSGLLGNLVGGGGL